MSRIFVYIVGIALTAYNAKTRYLGLLNPMYNSQHFTGLKACNNNRSAEMWDLRFKKNVRGYLSQCPCLEG